ncbi:DNA-binding protein [Streptomyces qinglanensis]|uniref:DNA-binding protein n=1 Tax=Streptomyces qinglanensis TaxID=943816 RepID=UPI003D73019A
MTASEQGALGFTELFDLPVAVNVRTAARALCICPATAYQLIRQDAFPCPVLRIGHQYRVPTTELMRVLGIAERPVYTVDLGESADPPPEVLTT